MWQVSLLKRGEIVAPWRRLQPEGWLSYVALIAVVAMACGLEAQTVTTASKDMAPPDVYAHMRRVHDHLELIRLEMGKPKETRPELRVAAAEPREVYFQALRLFDMVNRLSFDLTRERVPLPDKPVGTLRLAHVIAVLDTVLVQLQHVKDSLGITESSHDSPLDLAVTPSAIFGSIVQANRQIDLLLDRPISPSDAFQQVTLAVGYAAQLRTRFAGTRLPEAPSFARRKRPADVYDRLIACFARVRAIMAHSSFSVLTLAPPPEVVTSHDVYNLAAFIASELSFLHAQADGALSPPEPYYPGRKFPSDVYQRAGLLESLLVDLQALVEAAPSWLQAQEERE